MLYIILDHNLLEFLNALIIVVNLVLFFQLFMNIGQIFFLGVPPAVDNILEFDLAIIVDATGLRLDVVEAFVDVLVQGPQFFPVNRFHRFPRVLL